MQQPRLWTAASAFTPNKTTAELYNNRAQDKADITPDTRHARVISLVYNHSSIMVYGDPELKFKRDARRKIMERVKGIEPSS
jgi:hypothetical protein